MISKKDPISSLIPMKNVVFSDLGASPPKQLDLLLLQLLLVVVAAAAAV